MWGLESSCSLLSSPLRVPALPVKNLNGTGPVHPALAGEVQPRTPKEGGAQEEAASPVGLLTPPLNELVGGAQRKRPRPLGLGPRVGWARKKYSTWL